MNTSLRLQALSIGKLLDKAFRIYRANFVVFVGIVALGLIPTTFLRVISLTYFDTSQLVDRLEQFFIHSLISLALTASISQSYLYQHTITIREALRLGLRGYGSLLGAYFLQGLAIGIPAVILVFCAIEVGLSTNSEIGLIAFLIIIIILAVFIGTRWAMVLPCVALEETGATDSLGRSWDLTKGYFWRVLGTSMLAGILVLIIAALPEIVLLFVIEAFIDSSFINALLSTIAAQFALILTLPLSVTVTTLIYFDLRVRKEGYDLELMTQETLPVAEDTLPGL